MLYSWGIATGTWVCEHRLTTGAGLSMLQHKAMHHAANHRERAGGLLWP